MTAHRPSASVDLAEQKTYWQNKLSGPLPVLDAILDHPHPPIQSFLRADHSIHVDQPLYRDLKTLCVRENVTLFTVLLAGFKALLLRYTGQPDTIVGSLSAGSAPESEEPEPQQFANPVVLRTDLGGDPPARELLERVARTAEECAAHRDYPFEALLEAVEAPQELNRAPIFQAMLLLLDSPCELSAAPISDRDLAAAGEYLARTDLTILASEQADGLRLTCEYDAELFERATIECLLGHLQRLLAGLAGDLEQPLSSLSLLTAAEQQQLLIDWNETGTAYPHTACLHHLFEVQVERTPQAAAVIFGAERLSYDQLNRRANQLAHYLQTLGVGPETRVGLCLEPSLEMMVALLAVLKSGGAYVPLDPNQPPERLAFMLADAQASILLTQARLQDRLPSTPAQQLCLDADWAAIAAQQEQNPTGPVNAENLAYLIYTSGSTGRPKGVMIPHRGLVNYLSWCLQSYAVAAGSGAPLHSSIAFDLSLTGLFGPLLAGRSVTLLAAETGLETAAPAGDGSGPFSLIKLTPAHLELLNRLLPPARAATLSRRLVIGGEALWGQQVAFWQRHAPGTTLINEYGPTETVVGSCVYQVPGPAPIAGVVPIGRPIANTQLYVLDAKLQPVPIGLPGEIYIGGAGVARGYHNRPALTAGRFIPDPFSPRPGARLYKSGDLARYRPDGNLEFLGRVDHQLKIRGYRIEPGEIETLLGQHPAVQQAVVIAREESPGDKRLAAYLLANRQDHATRPADGSQNLPDDLRRFLQATLPDYMIPSAFVRLDRWPLTPNGKIDRRALPPPGAAEAPSTETYTAPRNAAEETLVEIWAEVLGLERIGIYDNFFELGGHSLLAIQLISRLRDAFQIEISLRGLFDLPTAADMAQHLAAVQWATQNKPATMDHNRDEGTI